MEHCTSSSIKRFELLVCFAVLQRLTYKTPEMLISNLHKKMHKKMPKKLTKNGIQMEITRTRHLANRLRTSEMCIKPL